MAKQRLFNEGSFRDEKELCFALCRDKLAVAGYQFCILTLEEKIAKQKDLPEDVLSGGQPCLSKASHLFSVSLSLMLFLYCLNTIFMSIYCLHTA